MSIIIIKLTEHNTQYTKTKNYFVDFKDLRTPLDDFLSKFIVHPLANE